MSFSLNSIFTTHTALPKERCITEISPSPSLSPYIRCFWKYSGSSPDNVNFRVIPDCCADIIIPLDGYPPIFVGLSDTSFITKRMGDVFGIRFYAWAVAPFLHIGLSEMFNNAVSVDSILKKFDILQKAITEAKTTARQVELAEKYFSRIFDGKLSYEVMNSLYYAVENNCSISVNGLSDYCAVSKRTLERKFIENIGTSPKAMIDLLRYQLLWQESITKGFSAADSAFKLGYYDEAHMYNDFKRYHGIGLGAAQAEYKKLSHFYNTTT